MRGKELTSHHTWNFGGMGTGVRKTPSSYFSIPLSPLPPCQAYVSCLSAELFLLLYCIHLTSLSSSIIRTPPPAPPPLPPRQASASSYLSVELSFLLSYIYLACFSPPIRSELILIIIIFLFRLPLLFFYTFLSFPFPFLVLIHVLVFLTLSLTYPHFLPFPFITHILHLRILLRLPLLFLYTFLSLLFPDS